MNILTDDEDEKQKSPIIYSNLPKNQANINNVVCEKRQNIVVNDEKSVKIALKSGVKIGSKLIKKEINHSSSPTNE